MPTQVCVLTYTPSPYQVELFDEVQRQGRVSLEVLYLHPHEVGRLWKERTRHHPGTLLPDASGQNAPSEALRKVKEADLFVLNYYHDPRAMALLKARLTVSRPWVFWGERPGYRHRLLGRLLRRVKLRALHQSQAPIWGIGAWAVEGYKAEFGHSRPYVNLPYFSDIQRFQTTATQTANAPDTRTFLFSGSLVPRKGVDLLARAFRQLVSEFPQVRLIFMGSGPDEEALRREVSACGDRVQFAGFVDWDHLPGMYQSGHVLCVPSRHDGWGLVVPEGLASGLPVIGTDHTGAAREFIRTGVNGWLVQAGDEGGLHTAMRQAAALSHSQMQEASAHAAASVAEHSLARGASRFADAVGNAVAPPAL